MCAHAAFHWISGFGSVSPPTTASTGYDALTARSCCHSFENVGFGRLNFSPNTGCPNLALRPRWNDSSVPHHRPTPKPLSKSNECRLESHEMHSEICRSRHRRLPILICKSLVHRSLNLFQLQHLTAAGDKLAFNSVAQGSLWAALYLFP